MRAPVITLLTDFGTADGYVAEMKGVLAVGAPGIPIVDATHDVPAQDVNFGRLVLARYWRRFPEGTVHLAVVDPGVGTARAAIAVESSGRFLVGPDNGLLSPALFGPEVRVVRLPVPVRASATFHGRDVFAPAAARLANGESLLDLGAEWTEPVRQRTPEPRRRADGAIVGEILTIDRFGNAITNLLARADGTVAVAGQLLPVSRTFADVDTGTATAVVGSSGLLEIAVRDGDACRQLALTRGTPVVWVPVR